MPVHTCQYIHIHANAHMYLLPRSLKLLIVHTHTHTRRAATPTHLATLRALPREVHDVERKIGEILLGLLRGRGTKTLVVLDRPPRESLTYLLTYT
jgi:hypothetical protein